MCRSGFTNAKDTQRKAFNFEQVPEVVIDLTLSECYFIHNLAGWRFTYTSGLAGVSYVSIIVQDRNNLTFT